MKYKNRKQFFEATDNSRPKHAIFCPEPPFPAHLNGYCAFLRSTFHVFPNFVSAETNRALFIYFFGFREAADIVGGKREESSAYAAQKENGCQMRSMQNEHRMNERS